MGLIGKPSSEGAEEPPAGRCLQSGSHQDTALRGAAGCTHEKVYQDLLTSHLRSSTGKAIHEKVPGPMTHWEAT